MRTVILRNEGSVVAIRRVRILRKLRMTCTSDRTRNLRDAVLSEGTPLISPGDRKGASEAMRSAVRLTAAARLLSEGTLLISPGNRKGASEAMRSAVRLTAAARLLSEGTLLISPGDRKGASEAMR